MPALASLSLPLINVIGNLIYGQKSESTLFCLIRKTLSTLDNSSRRESKCFNLIVKDSWCFIFYLIPRS